MANPGDAVTAVFANLARLRQWRTATKPDGSPAPRLRKVAQLLPGWQTFLDFLVRSDDETLGQARERLIATLDGVRVDAAELSALAAVIEGIPRPVMDRHVIAVHPGGHGPALPMVRVPGSVDLVLTAPLRAVEVDGLPMATPTMNGEAARRCYRLAKNSGRLFPAPRQIDGRTTGDLILRALAVLPLTGDERSAGLIRADAFRLSVLAFALAGGATVPEAAGVMFLTGSRSLTESNRRRWWNAVRLLRSLELTINPRTGEFVTLAAAEGEPGALATIGPPHWWRRADGPRWRLSGGLFRPAALLGDTRGSGYGLERSAALARTLAGMEAALAYGPAAGRGKGGRTPDALRPERKGGPGPAVFAPAAEVLRLSGEAVPARIRPDSAAGRRYRRRVAALVEAGYLVRPTGGPAPARDAVEVVRIVKGREAGIWYRATARFVEAQRLAEAKQWTRLPAARLLAPGGE